VSNIGNVANGMIIVQGLQTNIPQGQAGIGPFTIPCSPISMATITGAGVTNESYFVPTIGPGNDVVPAGVILIPTFAADASYQAGFISGQLTYLSPYYPTIWTFDPANLPAAIFVTVSPVTFASVTIQFF